MIPVKKSEIVSTLGDLESKNFSVNVSDQAFHLLFDGLYSNKIQSVLREIMSNALDGHIANGNPDQPFRVNLPTAMNPTLSIRDFGCSLSHEDVMDLYSTVFKSTKQESNDFVGSMGLGSKSPFAYADSFTSIAYMDGKKRSYLVGLDEQRIPTITFIGEEDTTEEQGFEVTLPSSSNDYRSFVSNAKRVLLGFDVTPELNFNYEAPEVLVETDDWKVFKTLDSDLQYTVGGKIFIKMGCVLYPVEDKWSDLVGSESFLVVEIPIGSAAVSASREQLSMNPATEAVIDDALGSLAVEMGKAAQAQIDEATCMAEAWKIRGNLSGNIPTSIIEALRFRGTKLYQNSQAVLECKVTQYSRSNWDSTNTGTDLSFSPVEFTEDDRYRGIPPTTWNKRQQVHTPGWSAMKKFTLLSVGWNSINKNATIFIDRDEKMPRKKLRLKKYEDGEALVYGWNQSKNTGFLVLHHPSNKDIKKLVRAFSLKPENIKSITQIDDVETNRNKAKKTTAYIHEYDGSNKHVEATEVETDANKFYWLPIEKKGGKVKVDYGMGNGVESINLGEYRDVFKSFHAKELYDTTKPVYHVTASVLKENGWKDKNRLDLVIKKKADKTRADVSQRIKARMVHHRYLHDAVTDLLGYEKDYALQLPFDYSIKWISRFYEKDFVDKLSQEVQAEVDKATGTYPVLQHLEQGTPKEVVQLYIDTVDCYNQVNN